MSITFLTAATATSAACAGVAGGVYFAFSAIVMPALRTLPASEAVPAMQGINISAVRLPFMAVFFGGAAASATVILTDLASAAATQTVPGRSLGAGLALAATAITVVRNVPLNNRLARLAPHAVETPARWKEFDQRWSSANHARAAAAIAAAAVLLGSLSDSALLSM